MTQRSDNPADPFKKALAEATKTMADDPELTVTYSVDPPGMAGDTMRLPQVSRRMTRDEVLIARGTADAFALRHRHHDAKVAAKYMPQGQMARDLYEAMETARCEAVGARDMPGTLGNIDARIGAEADRRGYGSIRQAQDAPLAQAAGYLVRHLATATGLPPSSAVSAGVRLLAPTIADDEAAPWSSAASSSPSFAAGVFAASTGISRTWTKRS